MSSVGVSLDELTAGCPRLARRLARGVVAAADVAVLVRSELVARNYASLVVAGTPFERWDAEVWKASGLAYEGSVVRPLAWHPGWLDHHGATAPDEAPSRRIGRRRDGSVPADRFYQQAMRRSTAKTVGQRDALRATALAGPGDTVTCVLPTGTGKTDVVLARVLRNRPRQSLIVVPTIALAVDLERRVQSLLPGTDERFAYFGSGDPSDKERIRLGVADGSQWLTIAGPEAACTALAGPLMDAALRGTLDLIVVDEAHIVAEWGDAFRPAFQAFAGLRQRLLETAPTERQAATVLLTGTLDSYGLTTLTRLFPGRNRLLVSGQTTRPEPAWWFARCSDEDDKRNKLIEALHHMPRPALVYTTLHRSRRSTNTGTVRGWLADAGFHALTEVAGNAKPSAREAAVRGLRLEGTPADDLDVVVATSAFGLGVDIEDIRTVIHACVPESVDRLYQEVGRSGRDGCASAALALWTPADMHVANDMAHERLIGPDLAWRRWESMRQGQWSGNRLTVDLRADHAAVTYPSSDANIYWNTQTLAAMDRAGMLQRLWPVPEHTADDASDDELEDFFDSQRTAATVKVLHSDIENPDVFHARLTASQRMVRNADSAGLSAATDLIRDLDQCVNRYLARHYLLEDGAGNQFPVSMGCGGCPYCRRIGQFPSAPPNHSTMLAGELRTDALDDLTALCPNGRMSVRLDNPDEQAVSALVDRLVRRGIVMIVAATSDRGWRSRATEPWWIEDIYAWAAQPDPPWRVPTFLLLDESVDDLVSIQALARLARQPLGILLTWASRLDPNNPKQFLHEAWTPSYQIEDVLRRI